VNIRVAVHRVRELFQDFNRHDAFQLAASLSYYTLLSFAPLVLVVIAVAAIFFGRSAVEERIVTEMHSLVGQSGADLMQSVLRNAGDEKHGVALAVGIATLIAGATTVFVQLQSALNRIWDVESTPRQGAFVKAILSRVMSFAMVVSIGFLLLVSLLASAGLAAMQGWAHTRFALPEQFWHSIDALVSFAVVTMLIALIFKILPDTPIAWRHVWFGALVTALLFTVGKIGIGFYLGRASIGSAYGAAGSAVVLMAWTYYAALIFFLGALITRVHAKHGEAHAVESHAAAGTMKMA
jgi:membrane protein